MCRYSAPPGYVRTRPAEKPKLGPLLPVIEAILEADRAAPVKQVAAVTAPFILANSLAGLAGGLAAGGALPEVHLSLVAAAMAGGVIGAQLGAFQLPVRALRLLIAAVLAVASVKLLPL
jgi:hypothetical protein